MVREKFECDSIYQILSMEIQTTEENDFLYWHNHRSGIDTVKIGYAILLDNDRNPHHMRGMMSFTNLFGN